MSKIPRCFITPTSKLPLVNATPIPVNIPKFICPNQTPSELKNTPLNEMKADIPNTKENVIEKSVNVKVIEKASIKRNAAPANQHPPKKLIKLAPKTPTISAKIAPYDYKARFNDLADKHKILKSEYSELKEKFDECSDELETIKSSLDCISSKKAAVSTQLDSLKADHVNLKSQFEDISKNYESEKKTSIELLATVEDLKNEVTKLNNELSSITTELKETTNKFSCKLVEYDLLKKAFENEVLKCSQLSSVCEENQVKIISYTSELTFLNTRQKIIDQKNEESARTIVSLKQENEGLNKKINNLTENFQKVEKNLEEKSVECDGYKKAYDLETQKCHEMNLVIHEKTEEIINYSNNLSKVTVCKDLLELKNTRDCEKIDNLTQQNIELQKTIETMYENQKKLRNEIQDLKGHIRVFCRIRPSLPGESSKQLLSVDVVDSCTMEVEKSVFSGVSGVSKKQKHNFSFDGVFPPNSPQSDVFAEVSSMIQSALDGYNVCIFAYGQTGSGKTYTMEGINDADKIGIIPRAIEMIFSSMPNLKKVGWEFTIHASFLEIYNENIYDLLNPNKDQEDHSIKMVDSKGSDVYVTNLKEELVCNSAELLKLLMMSQKNRQTAETMCNERSSRSHSVSKIKISAFHPQRKERYVSNLNLVDLAGSESAKTSQRMDETKCINKSLSELSKVILALQSKQSHIPYRNSKLTYLLMPSLGGNSKTLMLVNIAQFDECYQETINSLRFAAKVNSCRNGIVKKNISTT